MATCSPTPIIPGQGGAAGQAQNGLPAAPQPDNAVATQSMPVATQNQSNAVQSFNQLGNRNTTASSPLYSYTLQPGVQNTQFNFVPNVLNQYANYTYHIRWSMVSDDQSRMVQSSGSSIYYSMPKIIIAESGATALYNITELTIESLPPGNPKTPSTEDTKAFMTVVEPYGITLMDNIYSASQGLGIKNYWTNNSYFLEVWFTGYNEDGSIATTTMEKNMYKLWQLQMLNMESDTTEAGTTYRFKMTPSEMYAHADHVGIVSNAINIGPVTTVGAFFDQLSNVLTAQNANLYNDKKPRISYVINTPNWMRNWQFSQAPTTSQRNSDISVSSGSVNRPTISVGRGMDLTTVLNFVMSMTKEGQNYTSGEASSGNAGGAGASGASLRINGMANLVVIHSRTKLLTPFDNLTNDYPRQVIYTFMRYPTGKAIVDQANAARTRQPSQQASRQQALARSNRFVKHYFWTYTGQNLDVLKYELKLQWMGQTPIPRNLGDLTYPNFTVGPQYNQSGVSNQLLQQYIAAKNNQQAAQTEVQKAQANLLQNPNSKVAQQQYAAATQQLGQYNQQLSSIQQSNPNINFENAAANQTPSAAATAAAAREANNGETVARNAANQATLNAQPNGAQNLNGIGATQVRQTLYLEDIATSTLGPMALPISFRADPMPTSQSTVGGSDGPQENSSANSNAGNLPPSRSLVANVLDEVGQQGVLKIELDIRGDPYWLGIGNVDLGIAVGDGNSPVPDTSAAYNGFNGDVGFVFTLRTGQSYNEQTGIMDLSDNVLMWNGFYFVTNIKSTLKDGQFTQVLSGKRDTLTDLPPQNQTNTQNQTPAQASVNAKITARAASTAITGGNY